MFLVLIVVILIRTPIHDEACRKKSKIYKKKQSIEFFLTKINLRMIQTKTGGEKRGWLHTFRHFQHLLWESTQDPRSRRLETCKSQLSLQADLQNPMPNRSVRSVHWTLYKSRIITLYSGLADGAEVIDYDTHKSKYTKPLSHHLSSRLGVDVI